MAIYIVTFAISTLFFKLADHVKKEQRTYIDVIAIILLCLLAGFRSAAIGTDTAGYIQPMIRGAISSHSIKDFFNYSWIVGFTQKSVMDYEIGYTLIVYFFSAIFKSIIVTQIVLELLAILPIYCALRVKRDVPIWFGMLVFMFLFFNGSMNLIRQTISMSFMLLAVTYWMKNERKKCVLVLICGVLFHTSGLLGIVIVFLYEYVGRDRNMGFKIFDKKIGINYINMFIAIIAGIVALMGIQLISAILTQFGLSRYVGYILGNIRFMPNQIINILPPAVLLLLSFKYFEGSQKEWAFYVLMITYSMIAGQFTSVNSFGGRIRLYFMIIAIYAYPLICKYYKHKKVVSAIMVSYLLFYWWFYYVFSGTDQTVPYEIIRKLV